MMVMSPKMLMINPLLTKPPLISLRMLFVMKVLGNPLMVTKHIMFPLLPGGK